MRNINTPHSSFNLKCADVRLTHVEFACKKEVYFDKWCNSRQVCTGFKKPRHVILIGEFKRCVCDDKKPRFIEININIKISKPVAYADHYAPT